MEMECIQSKEGWAEEEEECRLLALALSGTSMHSAIKERVPFTGEEFSTLHQTSPDHICREFSYEMSNGEITDPRAKYKQEYKALELWLARPWSVPSFDGREEIASISSPATSWTESPGRNDDMETPAEARRSDEYQRRNEPPHSTHDESFRSLGSAPKSVVRPLSDGDMELEEGYFRVKLPNGQVIVKQHGELEDMVKEQKIPEGWPAYREDDALWTKIFSTTAEDKLETKDTNDNTVVIKTDMPSLELLGEIEERTLSEEERTRLHDWFSMCARKASVAMKQLHPCTIDEQYLCASRSDCTRIQNPHEFNFSKQANIASERIKAHRVCMRRRRRMQSVCGTTIPPVSLELLASIQGEILEDRFNLRNIASGALQGAMAMLMKGKKRTENHRSGSWFS